MNTILIVLDLNGTIIDSNHKRRKGAFFDFKARCKYVYYRPGMKKFLSFLNEEPRIKIGIWTSCIASNAEVIISHVFEDIPLEFCFNREECTELPGPGFRTIKNLDRIWEKFPQWNAQNTWIIDDSPEKLDKQPENLIPIKTFIAGIDVADDQVLEEIQKYIEEKLV